MTDTEKNQMKVLLISSNIKIGGKKLNKQEHEIKILWNKDIMMHDTSSLNFIMIVLGLYLMLDMMQ